MKFRDLTGQRFAGLLVLSVSKERLSENTKYWLCKCDCGKLTLVTGSKLWTGNTKSCGCRKVEVARQRAIARHGGFCHGFTEKNRFYRIWKGIKIRSLHKNNPRFKNYAGRGITVCNSWLKFMSFKEDMYASYLQHVEEFGEKNTSIDRINNDGNYEPSNCRWATRRVQALNRRAKQALVR